MLCCGVIKKKKIYWRCSCMTEDGKQKRKTGKVAGKVGLI